MENQFTQAQLERLSAHLDDYMAWAEIWHKQAGGYTASDTAITIDRMEQWAAHLKNMTGKPETSRRRSMRQDFTAPENLPPGTIVPSYVKSFYYSHRKKESDLKDVFVTTHLAVPTTEILCTGCNQPINSPYFIKDGNWHMSCGKEHGLSKGENWI